MLMRPAVDRRAAARLIALGLLSLMAGCAARKPPEQPLRLVWPAPPEKTRIEFVRSISSQKDVNEDTTFTQTVVNFLAGIKPPPDVLTEPMGVAVSDDGNVVYVSDTGQSAIFVFDFGKRKFHKIEGVIGPIGLALDREQNLYVVEQAKKGVTVFNPEGKQVRFLTDKSIERPTGLALDRDRKRIYLADTAHTRSKEQTVKIFSLGREADREDRQGQGERAGAVPVSDLLGARPRGRSLRDRLAQLPGAGVRPQQQVCPQFRRARRRVGAVHAAQGSGAGQFWQRVRGRFGLEQRADIQPQRPGPPVLRRAGAVTRNAEEPDWQSQSTPPTTSTWATS